MRLHEFYFMKVLKCGGMKLSSHLQLSFKNIGRTSEEYPKKNVSRPNLASINPNNNKNYQEESVTSNIAFKNVYDITDDTSKEGMSMPLNWKPSNWSKDDHNVCRRRKV